MKNFLRFGLVMMLFVGLATTLTSCYKKKDTVAILTIVDANNDAIAGAEVTLNYVEGNDEPREGLEQTGSTDGSGKVSFNFNELYKSGQAGVFVLDVYVNGAVVGIIRVEQEETVEETIVVD